MSDRQSRGNGDRAGSEATEGGSPTAEPSDALAVLGEETRVRIIRALAAADGPLSFSELRRRAGVSDTGRFNYHLSLVCEHFAREVEEGYELDRAGAQLVTAADIEVSEDAGEAVSPEVCPVCGETDCDRLFHVHLSPSDHDARL